MGRMQINERKLKTGDHLSWAVNFWRSCCSFLLFLILCVLAFTL